MRPALRRAMVVLLAALFVLAGQPFVRTLDVRASDNAAVGGRLIVMWRTAPPTRLAVRGVASTRASAYAHRSVVTALPGDVAQTAARLREDPRVAAVVPDGIVKVADWPTDAAPNDPYYATSQPDLPLIGVPQAWLTTTGSASVTVAVLDTGLDVTHPDLAGLSVVYPRNEITDTTDVTDGHGHGTHVTGTVAASTNNGTGVAGIAPGARIMPVKVLSDAGSGTWSDIMDGIDWARVHGANVISMSLGANGTQSVFSFAQPTVDAAYAAGITIVAAAGNSGDGSYSFPASLNHVISVAATDNTAARASFSQFNSMVDIAAPGLGTESTLPGGRYAAWSGTSMATPHISAVAALVRSAHPDWSADTVEAAIEGTATDEGAAGRDDQYGFGLVSASRALAFTPGSWTPPSPSPTPTPSATPTPTPTPVPTPTTYPRVNSLAASPTAISYDPNRYCTSAVKATTVSVATAPVSATVAPAASVTLWYTRPNGTTSSRPMWISSSTTAGTTWRASISTLTDTALRGGSVAYWVVAGSAGGAQTRYPSGTATSLLTVRACPNIAPSVSTLAASPTTAWTNPLGTGSLPAGAGTLLSFSAAVADSDGVTSVNAVLSGAGLAVPLTVPMSLVNGFASTTLSPTSSGIQGGTLTWRVSATDRLGLTTTMTGAAVTIRRADTSATIGTPTASVASGAAPAITFTGSDPDATWGATTTTALASLAWYAVYTSAAGQRITTASATVGPTYVSSHTFRAQLSASWFNTGVTSAWLYVTPTVGDAYGGRTPGPTWILTAVPIGAPTVVSTSASTTKVATDPLGTGSVSATGAPASATFWAQVADTDLVQAVNLVLSGPGLVGTRTIPMTNNGGQSWSAAVNPASAGVTGTGTISWKVVATDVAGLSATSATKSLPVVRADTAGRVAVSSRAYDASGNVVVMIAADDPDAVFGATTATLTVSLRWSAVVGSATYALRTATATYLGSHTWKVVLPVATALNAAGSGSFSWTPLARDPYGNTTTGATSSLWVPRLGG